MKTAEEILETIPEWNYGQYRKIDVIKAMKEYTNQKLDFLSGQIKDCFDYDGNNYKLEIWRLIKAIKNK